MKSAAVWERDTVVHSGDRYFSLLLAELGRARVSIDLETYIYEDDESGRRLATALRDAAWRGVRVRVMVDGIGSPFWALRFLPELTQAGVEAKIYHPLPWVFWPYSMSFRRAFNRFLRLFKKVNRRNHRKSCVIDRRIAWVGSMNVSSVHLSEFSGARAWRDTAVRVEGPGVLALEEAYERAWRQARGLRKGVRRGIFRRKKKDDRIHPLVRLNDSRTRRKFYYDDLLWKITRANVRIWITNPYFVPSRALLRALRFAAWLGIDVRLIVPKKSDIFFMRWVVAAFYGTLLQSGVRIFEYLPTILHAKTVIIDDWACVGSTNLNYRSLLHDLEVDVAVTGLRSRTSLEKQFLRDQTHSREVTMADWTRLGWLTRFAGRVVLLFKYWI